MTRRWRIALASVACTGALLVLVAVIAVYWLLQPERFTASLQRQAQDAGLELHLASPASPTLFPRPALELQGITLNQVGATMPILLAARGRLALPWRTLLGGPTVISRLEIDAPRVDLDALQDWASSLPAGQGHVPRQIPRIDTGIVISRASVVRGNDILLDDLSLETGQLKPGERFSLDLTARDAGGDPVQMRLHATPRISGGGMLFEDIAVHLSHGPSSTVDLRGSARWHGAADAAADLSGRVDDADAGGYDLALHLTPANASDPLLLKLKLDGPGNHADVALPPLALAKWWSQLGTPGEARLTMPPGSGHIEADKLDLGGGFAAEGLRLDFGNDVAPASASSAPVNAETNAQTAPRP